MCSECNQSPCATTCPNGEPVVDEVLIECALCGKEVDEEEATYGICEKCWTDAQTLENAIKYGARRSEYLPCEFNEFYAYILTPEQINSALLQVVMDMKKFYYDFTIKTVKSFLHDDDGDFADWLKRKAGEA